MKLIRVQDWEEVKKVVMECFAGDIDLVDKYHIKAGTSLDECVEDTCSVLKDYTNYDFAFYKLINNAGSVCGFIGVEPEINYLTTFCLKKRYRVKEYKEDLWDIIREVFKGESFSCGLYSKNERAINYLINNGCSIGLRSTYNETPIVILNYLKKEEPCH